METIEDYIKERGITATSVHVGPDGGREFPGHHEYKVTFHLEGRVLSTEFHCNPCAISDKDEIHMAIREFLTPSQAHLRYSVLDRHPSPDQREYNILAEDMWPPLYSPPVEDVFKCIVDDADVTAPFEEWCADTGFNPDSIRDRGVYRACRNMRHKLMTFLGGPREYLRLLREYERR